MWYGHRIPSVCEIFVLLNLPQPTISASIVKWKHLGSMADHPQINITYRNCISEGSWTGSGSIIAGKSSPNNNEFKSSLTLQEKHQGV